MDFDFKNSFKDYSDQELIRTVLYPSAYQPEAIAAAEALLKERQVSDNDIARVRMHLEQEWQQEEERKRKSTIFKTTEFLEPVLDPRKATDAVKWVNILCIVQVIWLLAELVGDNFAIKVFSGSQFTLTMYIELVNFLASCAILYLFYYKRRAGWILSLSAVVFGFVVTAFKESVVWFKFGPTRDLASTFILVVYTAYFFILLRDNMVTFFSVSEVTKKKTILVSVLLAIAFIALMQVYAYILLQG